MSTAHGYSKALETRLLTWVKNANETGVGYTPENEMEQDILAVLAEEGGVKLISHHDGYQMSGFDIKAKVRPTPETIADAIISNIGNEPSYQDLRNGLIEAVERGRSLGLGLDYKEKN